jgi:hypothetical protein
VAINAVENDSHSSNAGTQDTETKIQFNNNN